MEYVEVNMETPEFLNSEMTHSFFSCIIFCRLKKIFKKIKLKRAILFLLLK